MKFLSDYIDFSLGRPIIVKEFAAPIGYFVAEFDLEHNDYHSIYIERLNGQKVNVKRIGSSFDTLQFEKSELDLIHSVMKKYMD